MDLSEAAAVVTEEIRVLDQIAADYDRQIARERADPWEGTEDEVKTLAARVAMTRKQAEAFRVALAEVARLTRERDEARKTIARLESFR